MYGSGIKPPEPLSLAANPHHRNLPDLKTQDRPASILKHSSRAESRQKNNLSCVSIHQGKEQRDFDLAGWNFDLAPVEDEDIEPLSDTWSATFQGPMGTPYENGLFRLKIRIPEDYPFRPWHAHGFS